eukprot:TRINITY_DN24021_c0_g1_i1.p1 TRINITY_DN24021_c0_g1~~TRINITY_DN24021_c0_g1_i1.p1  ORF type:complete len:208 (-),score=56.74 TRINITY_DN24021_c0_g1_i1:174-797(-)
MASSGAAPVHVCASFNVKRQAMPDFCEAAGRLLANARSDEGCRSFDLQREIGWARQVSSEAQSLFMVVQEWETADSLEKHVTASHALQFDATLKDSSMLACAPNLSIFGGALKPEELRALAAEARAAGDQEPDPPQEAPAVSAGLPPKPRQRSGGYNLSSSESRPGSGARARSIAGSEASRVTRGSGGAGAAQARARSSSRTGPAWK